MALLYLYMVQRVYTIYILKYISTFLAYSEHVHPITPIRHRTFNPANIPSSEGERCVPKTWKWRG